MWLVGKCGVQSSFSALTAVTQCTAAPDPTRNSFHGLCTSPTCTAIPTALQIRLTGCETPLASQIRQQYYSSPLIPRALSVLSLQRSPWNSHAALSEGTRFLFPCLGSEERKDCPVHHLLWGFWFPPLTTFCVTCSAFTAYGLQLPSSDLLSKRTSAPFPCLVSYCKTV